ncbi:MAG: hypothetical protein WA211_04545 [Candidatus Acidiferrales bacterium]|jgi:hypothetical protein
MTSKTLGTKFAVVLVATAACLFTLPARSQQSQNSQQPPAQSHDSMPGMDMSGMQHDPDKNPDAAKAANDDMSDHDMDMGAHMFMTDLRPANPADEKRAAEVLAQLRPAIEKYKDYRVALADGFKIFLPNVPQKHYHFTNYAYAIEAAFEFNPAHPTSLLYKKTSDGYELEGAMYTARRNATLDDLNARIPLSVARWHKHVNFCFGAKGGAVQQVNQKGFGFRSDITTQDACEQAGGRWYPQIFSWMVHVYPYESDPAKIWAH